MNINRLSKYIIVFLFFAFIVEVLILAPKDLGREVAKKEEARSGEVGEHKMDNPKIDQVMHGVHLIESKKDVKEWELWAVDAKGFKGTGNWELNSIKAEFSGGKRVTFVVTGDEGFVDIKTKNMKIKGNVRTQSSNGYVFFSENILYDSQRKVLSSPSEVRMRGPKDGEGNAITLNGDTMQANMGPSIMEVVGQVKGRKTISGSRVLKISSQKAIFSGKIRQAHFVGDVVLDIDSVRVSGPEAQFQYDRKKDVLKSIVVKGGARVSDLDKWATANLVSYHIEKDQYVFEGNPRIIQNNDELRGERIILSDKGRKVKVIKGRAKVQKFEALGSK